MYVKIITQETSISQRIHNTKSVSVQKGIPKMLRIVSSSDTTITFFS